MSYVLVIDDEAAVRTMLGMLLEQAGYEVAVARDGAHGLKLYRERKPALIITDLIMPERDGIDTIMELRKLDPAVQIIAISGGSRLIPTELLHAAKLLGAARTFTKPVNIQDLMQAVAELAAQ